MAALTVLADLGRNGTAAARVLGAERGADPPSCWCSEWSAFAAIAVLASSSGAKLNMRAVFLDVLNDVLGSLGVIVAAIVITTTGFQRADAIAGLFIAALIPPRAYELAHETLQVLMEFHPKDVDLDDMRAPILSVDHLLHVHDLQASTIGTGQPVLSGHVVLDDECFTCAADPRTIRSCLSSHFPVSVENATIRLETTRPGDEECPSAHCASG